MENVSKSFSSRQHQRIHAEMRQFGVGLSFLTWSPQHIPGGRRKMKSERAGETAAATLVSKRPFAHPFHVLRVGTA